MTGSKGSIRDLFPFTTLIQKKLSELYVETGMRAIDVARTVALDVSYTATEAYAAAVVYEVKSSKVLEVRTGKYDVHFPYIPGYLFMREAPPLLKVLSEVKTQYDLVLVDAHGRLHPRRAGLATIVGVLIGKATAGVAKSILTGRIVGRGAIRPIYIGDQIEGFYVKGSKEFYLSSGNLMSVYEIRDWIKGRNLLYPPELEEADRISKELRAISSEKNPS